jgi:ribonucleotide reductase alpha subunit
MECVKGDKDYLQVWPVNAEINEELTHKANNLNSYDDYEYDKMYSMVYTDKSKMSSIVKHGYIKKIKAKDLWNKLIHCAWNTAEPGIIFQTKHHNYSPDGVYPSFRGTCTNPCVTGDTKIHTNIGELEIKDIIDRINNGEEIKVLSYDNINDTVEYQQVNSGCLTRENANIIEIETEDGNKLRLTPDHKVYTENRGYI